MVKFNNPFFCFLQNSIFYITFLINHISQANKPWRIFQITLQILKKTHFFICFFNKFDQKKKLQ